MSNAEQVTKLMSESKDAERAIARIVCVATDRYTVFAADRRAVDFANDVVTARALAKFHGRGSYVKDQCGRIFPAAL